MSLRIFLTGRIDIESRGVAARTAVRFPGRQGRRAFAYLICERGRPIPREELATAIWSDVLPPAWDSALSALVSKLRRLLSDVDASRNATIAVDGGCYDVRLPLDAWVDIEAAAAAAEEAEATLRAGTPRTAWGPAIVAVSISSHTFLPGEEGEWLEQRRARLREILVRGLDSLTDASIAGGDTLGAVQAALRSVALEPFRETGYRRLMQAHAAAGNRAEALRVYERCRALLADELGVDPSPDLEALYLHLLRDGMSEASRVETGIDSLRASRPTQHRIPDDRPQ